jgi:hydrogenase expression/formation protein HypD
MKYLSEYRDGKIARGLADEIRRTASRQWVLMEVCGGQTHTIVKQGIDELVGGAVEMIHGPGCPVCVTPLEQIDRAMELASRPEVIFSSFGDMLRVPGSDCDLFQIRARGGDVRVVYSPLDALELARRHSDKQVVFFAVGFETTAPANAMAVWRAKEMGVQNFSVLVSHVTVPPAMVALLEAAENRVQGFLAAGHVCTVMGWTEYEPLAQKYQVPIVVTGFEPLDLLEGILMAVKQLEEGRHEVENQYVRSVPTRAGAGGKGVPVGGPPVAWHRHDSGKWVGVAAGVCRLRRGGPLRAAEHHGRGAGGVPGRRGAARHAQAQRVCRVRHALHAGAAAGCADGVVGRGVRSLLQLRPLPPGHGV